MARACATLPLFLLFLTACSPIGAPTPTRIPGGVATPPPALAVPPSTAPLGAFDRIILRYSSMSLVVEDPSQVLASIEALVLEAGGYVSSASSWSSSESTAYANLSARVPPDSLPALRRSVLELAMQVQSDSMSSQDITNQYRSLLDRQSELQRAKTDLRRLLSQATDPSTTDSLILLHDLLHAETSNVESQLQSYQESAGLSSFDISLTQPAALPPNE